ncbi:MAG: NAD(P)/FAD-dependent oxidoreductase [Bacteroidia bacterium]
MNAIIPRSNQPRIVIIGGGFGGITLAKALRGLPFQVVMIDRNNYHTFQPLLYQVATGGLEPDSIAFPLRKMFSHQDNFVFRLADVQTVDTDAKVLQTSIGAIRYDYLVMATGSCTNYFGNKAIETHAIGMKNIPESLDLRSFILQNFEAAHTEAEVDDRELLLKFIIVGGGPTGVETAGALAELKRHVLPSDYPELDLRQMEIHLIEAGDRLLGGMSEKSGRDAQEALEKLGVHVLLNTRVTAYDGERVTISTGRTLEASTVIWAAGIKGNVLPGLPETAIDRGQRLAVDAYNRVKDAPDVFAIGDVALMRTTDYPDGHPQVAPTAIQMAQNLARNLVRLSRGREMQPFVYFDKGSMATIGRNKAVIDFRSLHLKGFVAWLGWMFVHIMYLIGFRNKAVVFVNWVWSYFTYDKGTRLIIRPFRRRQPVAEPQHA